MGRKTLTGSASPIKRNVIADCLHCDDTEPATIEGEDSELTVVEGRQMMLPCRVGGLPAPVVRWSKDNVTVSPDDRRYRVLRSHSLAIPVVRYTLPVFTGREHDCSNTGVILDTRVRRPCSRAPVHTTREHGP